ncbi:SPOR domain-containing protein [Bartonella rattaustraliani]|uniref:SPOR domain-containing protein n=1 Tax=Bartonella rattaustraliani TaxID=481139 RepID=UPI000476E715|nr:SPOR domain-containing protein [Bartonella rattaustraliani]
MSDNDRKNSCEIKQDHEHHDPLERLMQIFNPNKQNASQHDQSSVQTDPSASQSPKVSSHDDFDLFFLEAEFENNLANDPPFDEQEKQRDFHATSNEQASYAMQTASSNNLEQKRFSSKEENSSSLSHDEEQILDALSPLPLQKNQSSQKRKASMHDEPFFDEVGIYNNRTPTEPVEQINRSSQTTGQQSNIANTQQNHSNLSENHPYTVSADQKNKMGEYYTDASALPTDVSSFFSSSDHISEGENAVNYEETNSPPPHSVAEPIDKSSDLKGFQQEGYPADYPQFNEEKFLEQESHTGKTPKYSDTQAQDIKISEKIFGEEVPYHQDHLNDTHASSKAFSSKQADHFSAHNYPHKDTPPPNVDTYKFSEEIVEKTGPIMVPELPYEAPQYDVSTDGLKEEFADVLNVGNVPEESFSHQHQQNQTFNEIFHQTMQNPGEDVYRDSQAQNANFPTENREYHTSPIRENSSHKDADQTPPHTPPSFPLKNFIIGKTFTKTIVLLLLIAAGFAGYFRFFVSPQENESPPIIHADNTPFKFKHETTETKNDAVHNLDIYKQTSEENAQQFLIDASEQPEDLAEINQQELISSSSNESDVEDAVTEAINHTIPTQEVQTVIVNKDGTIVLAPKHHTEQKTTNEQEEMIDKTAENQFQDSSPISSHDSDVNNNKTDGNLTRDINEIIAENISQIEEKFIPIPSPAERNSEQQIDAFSHSEQPNQALTQSSEGYYVQLSSQPTHALARDSLEKMQSKFGFLISARPLNIQSALIPGKGTYYRVRIQTQNRNDAISLCEDIKSYGGNCFVTR